LETKTFNEQIRAGNLNPFDREREVTYACWSDFRFAPQSKPGEDPESSIYVVQPKPDLKFCTKMSETRDVPIDDKLVKALKEHSAGWSSRPRRENRKDIFWRSSRLSRSALV
jgi:hypothetical protein